MTGTILCTTILTGAIVFYDNVQRTTLTNLRLTEVPEGQHVIRYAMDGKVGYETQVTILDWQESTVSHTFV